MQVETNRSARPPAIHKVADGGIDPDVIEAAGANFPGEAGELPDGVGGDRLDLGQACLQLRGSGHRLHDAVQAKSEQGQRLPERVMQFARYPFALCFLVRHDLPENFGQFGLYGGAPTLFLP